MADFEGVYPALITPMGADGKLNEKAFRNSNSIVFSC